MTAYVDFRWTVLTILFLVFPDYIVIGSDSGRIVILEYIPAKNTFEKVHQETFGKSGCRRIVPGQYLAIDPKGRAVMIGECSSLLRFNPNNYENHQSLLFTKRTDS